jgi:hypothetical protein
MGTGNIPKKIGGRVQGLAVSRINPERGGHRAPTGLAP